MTRIPRPGKAATTLAFAALIGCLVLAGQPARAEFFPNVPREPQHQAPQREHQPERRAEPRREPAPQRRDYRGDDRRYRGDDRYYEQRPYDRYHGGYGYGPPPVIYAPPSPPLFQFVFPGY